MKILAIETSCDETAIAIAEFSSVHGQLRTIKSQTDADRNIRIKILSNIVSSQVKLHAKFGGVVPNLAKREHQKNLVPILLKALKGAKFLNPKSQISNSKQFQNPKLKIQKSLNTKRYALNAILEREPELFARMVQKVFPLKPPPIDAIAVTYGPGLAPALWVGVNFAKALSFLWNKPLIPVNHMLGHLYSPLLQPERINSKYQILNSKQIRNSKFQNPNYLEFKISNLEFPAIALLVSGGHTELILMSAQGGSASGGKDYRKYKIIGETLDDAAGEAFDKVARLLGLSYPGGPAISALAEMEIRNPKFEIRNSKFKIKFPRPMINSKNYNFSFSGLKTAVLYFLQDHPEFLKSQKGKAAISKEFQNAVVDVLVSKTVRAAKEFKIKTILLGGGVAANELLRQRLGEELQKCMPNSKYLIPDTNLTGDNALMIALAAYLGKNKKTAWNKVQAESNLRLS